jgi:hypothetical protein
MIVSGQLIFVTAIDFRSFIMDDILKWISEYSPPIVLLILVGAISIYLIKMFIEKAISNSFDKVKKITELILERRSGFEEKVLLDQYTITISIQSKITSVATNVNRINSGHKIENFIVNNEIVPLTEVYEMLSNNKFLLPEKIYEVLTGQADVVMKLVNARDPKEVESLMQLYGQRMRDFEATMHEIFKLKTIKW